MKIAQLIIYLLGAALILRLWLYSEEESTPVKAIQTFILAILAYMLGSLTTIRRVK